MGDVIQGRVVVPGEASGELLVSTEPLSFWGGYDQQTGEIIDRRNALSGRNARGRILAVPNTVGSSTTTAVLLEAVRAGTAPAALITRGVDTFLALASVVAGEMYGRPIPIVSLDDAQFAKLQTGAQIRISAGGKIEASQPLPLVTIITPSYNMARYLIETIESVLNQDYPNIEYIVIDGGSTDATLDLLNRYAGRLRYVSEPDHGPSDAIAKGLRRACGEIVAWLNADDTYLPGSIRTAVDFLQSHPETDVVYGEGWWIDEDGAVISRYPTFAFNASVLERDCFICQPSAFLRASSYRRCPLDPNVTRSFDYDLWIRMSKAGLQFASIPEYLANSRMHKGAKTIYEREIVLQSSMNLLKKHYDYIPLPWIFGYTAYRLDRRDQFFEPLRYSAWKYLASLPVGLWFNRRKPLRFFNEWALKGARELWGRRPRLRRTPGPAC